METMYQYIDVNDVDNLPSNYTLVCHQQSQTVRYHCSKCDSHFTSKKFLHQHEVSVHNLLFHCPFCPCLFSNKADFRIHSNTHPERYLACPFCKKIFHLQDEYAAHVKSHTEPSVFRCDKCPAYFVQASMLRTHVATHAQKKFVHHIPEISENYSSRKLLKKVRKKLNLINKLTRANDRRREDSQTAASVQENSVPLNSVSVVSTPNDVNIQCEDNIRVIEPDLQNVPDSNRQENIRKNARSLKKKSNPTSDASTSTNRVPATDTVARTSSAKVRASQSAQKPILKTKSVLKRKQTPSENVNPNHISKSSTSSVSNRKESATQLKRKCRGVSSSRSNEVTEWNNDISAPPTNNKYSEKNSSSSAKINVERNLRPRNTVNYFASSPVKIKVQRNLRPRNTVENFYSELLHPVDNFVQPPRNNESNEKDFSSSATKNSKRTLRPRNVVKNLNRGFRAVEPKPSCNYRCGAKRKNTDIDETSQPTDSDCATENRTISGSNIPTGFFMCLSCKRMFQTYRLLNQHKELHIHNTGIRCNKCGGLFGGPGNLASHQKSSRCFPI